MQYLIGCLSAHHKMIMAIHLMGLLMFSLSGCGETCTMVGCHDSLNITVTDSQGAPVQVFSGELRVDGETISFICGGSSDTTSAYVCVENSILFRDASMAGPETSKQLSLTSGDAGAAESWSGPITPQYQAVYPNGEECDGEPVCSTGSLEITLAP